ncbi:G-protein coupled bile acid receptor 1-like [Chiloscyllium plagiosum]|uniref:G-protein coupled bile acid receptor 1-like n=1 Tax=Chiloscyllium plagiosum TaxID=36176 RepID=UPI001CB843EB|nr:G-protein coupled bile acid receptor 1-like [Chiloscyllium plagiosum]
MNESLDEECFNISNPDTCLASQMALITLIAAPLSSIIIVGNLVIMVGIIGNKSLHNPTNYYFLSLLLAGLATGIILPSIPMMNFKSEFAFQICFFFHLFPNFIFLAFLSNLLVVHYDRYVCIISPFQYAVSWIHKYVPIVIFTAWLLPLLFASLPLFGWNNWSPGAPLCYFKWIFLPAYIYLEMYGLLIPSILAITAMTSQVLHVARKQMKAIKKMHRAVHSDSASLEKQLDFKYTKCVMMLFITFLVCWVPYIVFIHVSFFVKNSGSRTRIILSCLGTSSAAFVPFILVFSNKEYFKLWRNVFRRVCQMRGNDASVN